MDSLRRTEGLPLWVSPYGNPRIKACLRRALLASAQPERFRLVEIGLTAREADVAQFGVAQAPQLVARTNAPSPFNDQRTHRTPWRRAEDTGVCGAMLHRAHSSLPAFLECRENFALGEVTPHGFPSR